MDQLLQSLKASFPQLRFVASTSFYWSPATQEVYFDQRGVKPAASWSLLHETAHALLEHQSYRLDFELLELEIAAWQKAQELANEHGMTIDTEYVENCLDSYRDWLHRRSVCPSCGTQALQRDSSSYQCFNCHVTWHVTPSRFCRPYRKSTTTKSPATM